MSRPRQHQSNAAKQAAYRERHARQKPPCQVLLAALVRTLHSTIQDAAADGDSLAVAVVGERSDEALSNLIAHFRGPRVKK
jgi:hypothetical protein